MTHLDHIEELKGNVGVIRPLSRFYRRGTLGMITDLYQLTMAQALFDSGMSKWEGVFSLHHRKSPFGGSFAVSCGKSHTVDYLKNFFRFTRADIKYLRSLQGNDGKPLFKGPFLSWLYNMRFSLDIDMPKEGTVIFANEPMVRVRGNLIQALLIETPLLCLNGFATLIATRAARTRLSLGRDTMLDMGLRRAQGFDGALIATWAAYVGGTDATSNVAAGKAYGIPVKGTFSHAFVMAFEKEFDAFMKYAESMLNNTTFLVDTYNTIAGVENAIKVAKTLAGLGIKFKFGIRLDSGNLSELSKVARQMLDDAGFPDAVIVASNDLDEYHIADLKEDGATIDVWGIGTMLITAFEQPAMGAVYKLCAIRAPGEDWRLVVKLSEDAIKTSIPGIQQVRRYYRQDTNEGQTITVFLGDVIFNELDSQYLDAVEIAGGGRFVAADADGVMYLDLLEPVFRAGQLVNDALPLAEIRAHRQAQVESLPAGVKLLKKADRYPVALERNLHNARMHLIDQARVRKAS